MGLRLRRREQYYRGIRALPAPEDRRGPGAEADPHSAGGRLRAAGRVMTLRARLTLWYSGLLAGALVLFGTAVYTLLSYSLTEQVNDTLLTTAEDIRSTALRTMEGSIVLPRLALDLTADVKVQLWSSEGQPLGEAEQLDPVLAGIGLPAEGLGMASADYHNLIFQSSNYP